MTKPTKEPKLLSCPFCGSYDADYCHSELRKSYWIRCLNCFTESPEMSNIKNLVKQWNQRANNMIVYNAKEFIEQVSKNKKGDGIIFIDSGESVKEKLTKWY